MGAHTRLVPFAAVASRPGSVLVRARSPCVCRGRPPALHARTTNEAMPTQPGAPLRRLLLEWAGRGGAGPGENGHRRARKDRAEGHLGRVRNPTLRGSFVQASLGPSPVPPHLNNLIYTACKTDDCAFAILELVSVHPRRTALMLWLMQARK